MSFKQTIGWLGLMFLVSGCWGGGSETKNKADFGFFKTPGAAEACVSSNVSQWEMTGKFLHSFLGCASNRSADGAETLSGLQNLLAQLDENKLQELLDFLLTVNPKGTTHEERYPYLLAASTLLDRGLVEGRINGLNLTNERLETLQDFLVSFDASKSQHIISSWSRSGHLAEVLDELGAFIDQLQDNSLESATHELLSGGILKPDFLYLSRRVLKEDLLFSNLSDSLAKRRARALTSSEQTRLLAPYREALTASDSQALAVNPVEGAIETTALKAFADKHTQYTPTVLQGLNSVLLSYWQSYQKLSEIERLSLDGRFASAMSSILGQQAHSVKWLLALLRDADTLKAKDLDRITYAVDQLVLEGNNLSLEAIRAKAGASKLTYQLQVMLSQGAKVPNCSYFDQAVLTSDSDFNSYAEVLNRLSTPQASCGGRIPLVAAIEFITGATISASCDNQPVCLAETSPLSTSQDLWAGAAPNPDLTKKLALDSLRRLQALTLDDPYALYNLQFAKDRVEPKILAELEKRLIDADDWSLNGLASLDEAISEQFADSLQKDFLEKLLTYRIEALTSQSHQFADLAPDQAEEIDSELERRSSRIFAGLYSDGPVEALFGKKFALSQFASTFNADQQDVKAYLESHPSVWSRIVYKSKQADGIFRSPSMGSLSGEDSVTFSGMGSSLRNYLGFNSEEGPATSLQAIINESSRHRIIQPLQATRAFADDEQGRSSWALWMQHYASGPLTVKDVPVALAAKLQDWYLQSFIPTVSGDAFWPELQAQSQLALPSGLGVEFFDVEPYTQTEARLISSYYFKQYQKPSQLLPLPPEVAFGRSSSPKSDLTAFANPISGFLSLSYLVKDDYESQYAAYAKAFPKVLNTAHKISELKAAILPDLATFQTKSADWNFGELAQVNDIARLPVDTASPMALLSSLDLLTFSKPQSKFLPQSLVGFYGKLCRSKAKDPAHPTVWIENPQACPLDFQGATEEEAYNKFREYISTVAIQSFCPFLATDTFGPHELWSERLGLALDSPILCKQPSSLPALAAYRFPTWHSAQVLNDIFMMGRKASLKAGLVQIPSAMRFYKLKHQELTGEHFAAEWLQQSKGVWSEKNATNQRRREFFAGGFWVGSPNLLNSYLNLLSQHVDSYTWRNVLIAFAEKDAKGVTKDILRDLLREWSSQQKMAAAADETAVTFALKLFDVVAENPEYRRFIANFLTDLNSSEAYDFYSNELPLATIQLFPPDLNPFDWKDPGLSFAKYFAQHTTLRSWQVLGESFNPQEVDRFIDQTHLSLRSIAELGDRAGLLAKLSSEAVELATLYLPDDATHLTERFETLASTWNHISLGQPFRRQWASVVSKLSEPLQGFNGENTLTGEVVLENFLTGIIKRGPLLLHSIQEASAFEEPLFWRNWADSILNSVADHSDGAAALANFLHQKRLDFDSGNLWVGLLHPGDLQAKAVLAIKAVDSVPETIWRAALNEEAQLSARLVRAFDFLRSHIIWKVDPEHNAFSIALDQLYELSRDETLRNKQLEVVKLWLKGETPPDSQSESNRSY